MSYNHYYEKPLTSEYGEFLEVVRKQLTPPFKKLFDQAQRRTKPHYLSRCINPDGSYKPLKKVLK